MKMAAMRLTDRFTRVEVPFGNPPGAPTLANARVVVYGVPFDDSATFGKGTHKGPAGMRHSSAYQIETYVVDEGIDLYETVAIHDLGDFRLARTLSEEDRDALQAETGDRSGALKRLSEVMEQFEALTEITRELRRMKKVPLMLGGEHTLTYWPLKAVAAEKPVVLHFDAHRDAKAEYLGMRMCHTTPMCHFLREHGKEVDFVQFGIRQTDAVEQEYCEKAGVVTFYPADIRRDLAKVCRWVNRRTRGRAVYVTFDIDALDIAYTPCTGTPEPFGLTPEEAVAIFRAIHPTAKLCGADMMEVGVRNGDHREATTAVQLILRLLARIR